MKPVLEWWPPFLVACAAIVISLTALGHAIEPPKPPPAVCVAVAPDVFKPGWQRHHVDRVHCTEWRLIEK